MISPARAAVIAVALSATGFGLLGMSSATAASSRQTTPSAPLATTVTTAQGSWATVAMGHLDDPTNTFWQTFYRPAGGTSWSLRTPPGVADNGGLVTSTDGDLTVIGFRPSQLLKFSPLAGTTDGGKHYTVGLLPSPLSDVPDALSVRADGHGVALSGDDILQSSSAVTADAGASGWHTLTTTTALATTPAGHACGLDGISAATIDQGGVVVGAACNHAGVVGVFEAHDGGFVREAIPLPASDAASHVAVVRLVRDGNGTAALLALTNGAATSYVAAWDRTGTEKWSLSSAEIAPGATVSTSVTADTGFGLVTSGPTGRLAAAVVEPADPSWRSLPAPPAGTATLSVSPTGRIDALTVQSDIFTDDRLRAGHWVRAQTIPVTLAYGSSS